MQLLNEGAPRGVVFYADDDFLSQQVLKRNFNDMGYRDSLVTFNDG